MLVGQRSSNIKRGQQGKYIRLQALNHKLKKGQHNSDGEGKRTNQLESNYTLQKVFTAENEDQQQKVAGEHICK